MRSCFRRAFWSPVIACAIAGLPLAISPPAQAQVAPTPEEAGLPYFDARLNPNETAAPATAAALVHARKNASPAREAEIARLRAFIPLLAIDDDIRFGTPHFIRSTAAFLTEPSKRRPADVTREFIAAHPALFEISPDELTGARVSRDYVTRHNGVTHLTYTQQISGVDLYQAEVRANVAGDGSLVNISSTMLPRPVSGFSVKAPVLSDAQAIDAAARHCGVTLKVPCVPVGDPAGANLKRAWTNSPDLRPDEPVTTELMYFPLTRDDIRTAWKVVVPVKGIGHTYDTIVDAVTGELLWRQSRLCFATTQAITFRVYTSDSPAPGSPGTTTPSGSQFPFVARSLVTVTPEMMQTYSPNGWINDNGQETIGNNCAAHLDRDANNSADLPRPNGGALRVFDFPFDPALEPVGQGNAAVTQLFYLANLYHDTMYSLGFTEEAGNFQTLNLISGRGSGANDAVQLDAQDGSGTNNANFSTNGTDGSSARCQMYIFSGPTPDRDGDFDADIVYHELTHGTSIRLHGGLSGVQPQSMGEGWGDFVGICLNSQPGDDPNGVYAMGGYATFNFTPFGGLSYSTNYYYGIRRYPYSTDLSKNPHLYHHIDINDQDPGVPRNPGIATTSAPNGVHNAGEVWCNTLVECRANLMEDHGFSGNGRTLALVIDGMAISPGNPNFLQARDAILQSNMTNHDSADIERLWEAFARRGMGFSALSPNGTSDDGVQDGFDVPRAVVFSFPGARPSSLDAGVEAVFPVRVRPMGGLTITNGTAQLVYSVNGGAFTGVPMTLNGPDQYTATIPAQPCFSNLRYYLTVETSDGTRTMPGNAPANVYTVATASGGTVTLSDSFEAANPGWAVTPGTPAATTGQWTRMAPQATAAQPGAARTGTNCWVTNGTAGASVGANDVDGGQTILASPAFDVSGFGDARVSYWRWYSNNQGSNPGVETFLVDVSTNNGGTWTRAETVGPATQNAGGWLQGSWTLGSLGLSPTSQVRVRFIAQDTVGAVVEAAVDDLLIEGLTCTLPPTCGNADFNGDGDYGTDADIEAFFACLGGSCCATCWQGGADFNGDGDSGTDADIEAFFRVLGGGAC